MNNSFQANVADWMLACFGEDISRDVVERNHRFLEESLELVQSLGCTKSEAHQLVDYVFNRPVGAPLQEVGGVMVTLAALCNAHRMDANWCGKTELDRVWTKVEQIRAKQAAKPKHSPLPIEEERFTILECVKIGVEVTVIRVPIQDWPEWVSVEQLLRKSDTISEGNNPHVM